jgi:cytochrome P450
MTVEPITDDAGNLLGPEAVADPYGFFGALREDDPVHWNERYRSWVITRYADVAAAFRDERFSADRIGPYLEASSRTMDGGLRATFAVLSDWLVFKDPPDHTRLRRLVHRAFTPRAVTRMQERVASIADELIDAFADDGEADLIESFAYPLPAIVIAEMLGVPAEDRDLFKRWSDDLSGLVFGGMEDPNRHRRAVSGMAELVEYLEGLIQRYTAQPEENLITSLVRAREEHDQLSEAEVVATCTLLLFGGHETTTNLIGNGLLALLEHPAERRRLQEDPALTKGAVEEILRFDGPAKAVARLMKDDVVLHGRTLRRGDRVFLVPAAANRDPRQFAEPDRFDVGRGDSSHLGFGFGIHYCLGAPLARLEGTIAIRLLLERLPSLALAAESLDWHPVLLSRGLRRLPVVFGT